ncbi:MAG: hypothetical protein N5P05_004100 (plasmid) [Chroococcopsis gigantea SAG 12.99]|nr:hypothetical protein [Chroococcopsis gigantea SAG 12.99]
MFSFTGMERINEARMVRCLFLLGVSTSLTPLNEAGARYLAYLLPCNIVSVAAGQQDEVR